MLWSLLFRIHLLIIHLRNYEAFFCFMLIFKKDIEIWCLALLLKTGNIVHELVTESFTNQKTRLTIVHERLFSINRLVPLDIFYSKKKLQGTRCQSQICHLFRMVHDSLSYKMSFSNTNLSLSGIQGTPLPYLGPVPLW